MLVFTACRGQESLTKVNKVKKILSASEILLANDRHVQLAGLKTPREIAADAMARLEDVLLTRVAIIEPIESNSPSCIVYVWGRIDLPRAVILPVERKGFANVDMGFMNVQKGVAINVNALLIREGYALVDTNASLTNIRSYIELQKLAQKEKKGIWLNRRTDL